MLALFFLRKLLKEYSEYSVYMADGREASFRSSEGRSGLPKKRLHPAEGRRLDGGFVAVEILYTVIPAIHDVDSGEANGKSYRERLTELPVP